MAGKKQRKPVLYAACRVVTMIARLAGTCTFCNDLVAYTGTVHTEEPVFQLRWRKNSPTEHSINFSRECAIQVATLLMEAVTAYDKGLAPIGVEQPEQTPV